MRAPDSEKSANGGVEWSCSSCFFYAVRGRTEGAPPLVEGPALLSALKKLAKHHKKTQTPSEVPSSLTTPGGVPASSRNSRVHVVYMS